MPVKQKPRLAHWRRRGDLRLLDRGRTRSTASSPIDRCTNPRARAPISQRATRDCPRLSRTFGVDSHEGDHCSGTARLRVRETKSRAPMIDSTACHREGPRPPRAVRETVLTSGRDSQAQRGEFSESECRASTPRTHYDAKTSFVSLGVGARRQLEPHLEEIAVEITGE